jgi:hypothetical protein
MSYPWDEYPDYLSHFLSAQQLSQELAAAVEDPNAGSTTEEPVAQFGLARVSTTTSEPPHWLGMIVEAQQTPPQPEETMTLEYPPAGSSVRYPTPGRTESRFGFSRPVIYMTDPPRPSSNPTPTQRPETQNQTTGLEEPCCLQCAKESHKFRCVFGGRSRTGNSCIRCVAYDYACTPIPAEYLAEFRTIQQLYREGNASDALAAREAWVKSMEPTTPLARVERQLFLLNRNVERLLNVQLRMVSLPVLVWTDVWLTLVDWGTCRTDY